MASQTLPVGILYGVYLGVLTGIIPALVAGALGFLFKYAINVTVPGLGVVALSTALAGLNGGLLVLADPTIIQSANAPTIVTGLLVVMLMSFYSHARGDALGAVLPKRLSLRSLGEQTLSLDLVDLVSGREEIRIRVTGDVEDIEGYPPLPADLRAAIAGSEWRLPVDLPVSQLEARLAERLRTTHDLGDVSVDIDERGRASVAAAPPFSGLSRRVESGKRAVSVSALVPTGLARGDVVTALTPDARVRGTVVSARSSAASASDPDPAPDPEAGDSVETDTDEKPRAVTAPTTRGGEGQVTLAVARSEVRPLLRADGAMVVVEARGTRHEYEVISLLRRAGRRFKRLTVGKGSSVDGATVGTLDSRREYEVAVLAVRTAEGWQFAPDGGIRLTAGDELFAVGTDGALSSFEEAVA